VCPDRARSTTSTGARTGPRLRTPAVDPRSAQLRSRGHRSRGRAFDTTPRGDDHRIAPARRQQHARAHRASSGAGAQTAARSLRSLWPRCERPTAHPRGAAAADDARKRAIRPQTPSPDEARARPLTTRTLTDGTASIAPERSSHSASATCIHIVESRDFARRRRTCEPYSLRTLNSSNLAGSGRPVRPYGTWLDRAGRGSTGLLIRRSLVRIPAGGAANAAAEPNLRSRRLVYQLSRTLNVSLVTYLTAVGFAV
jgi:hypothetical protein